MPKLIKRVEGRFQVVDDAWQHLTLAADADPASAPLPDGPVIVPLALWQARRETLLARGQVAVWLDSHERAEAIAADLAKLPLVALNFPKFADGRAYSTATLLRGRYAYAGELRAVGDVLRDQFFYMKRCGFDALQPRSERYTDAQLQAALASLQDFSEPYQGATDQAEPLFRRQARGVTQ